MSTECCVGIFTHAQLLVSFYTRFVRLLGKGSQILLSVGELVLSMAVRCAPQARAKVFSGKKSQPSGAD